MSFQTFLLRKRFHFVIFIALSFTVGVGFLHLRSLSFGYKEDSSGLRPSNLESHGEEKLSAAITRPISMTSHLSLPPIATPSAISPPAKVGAIVAATRAGGDNSWMEELEDRWEAYLYDVDDPNPPAHLWIPKAKGHEAVVYLSFIISNYENLPPYTVFIHGHRQSWHQEGDIVTLLSDLRIDALEKAGYIPLRCDWYPSCPREIRPLDHDAVVWGPGVHREETEIEIGKAWAHLFGPSVEIPHTVASQCCAQFAVTKDAIKRRTKGDYERMREWLLNTDLIDDVSGRVMEKLWAYIMTNEAVRCPPPQTCACEYFGHCSPKDWPTPPPGLDMWPP